MPLRLIPQARVHQPTGRLRVRYQGRDFYFGPFDDPASHEKFERWRAELLVRQVFPEARVAGVTGNAGPTVNAILLAYLKHAEVYYQQDGQPPAVECGQRGTDCRAREGCRGDIHA